MKRKKTSVRGWRRPQDIDGCEPMGGIPYDEGYVAAGAPCVLPGCTNPAKRNRRMCEAHLKQLQRGKPLRPIHRVGIKTPTYEQLLAVLTS